MRRRQFLGLALGALGAGPLRAQRRESYAGRLSWVPISGAERADVAGRGSATATLAGHRLTIAGSFEGLPATATIARLHQGVAVGARGRAIADLTVTHARAGRIEGEVQLNREQLAALRAGHVYVQIHAEQGVAPDNAQLFGWLLRELAP